MKQGTLFYDSISERMDFEYDIEKYYGGLHCGESFEAYINQNTTQWGEKNYQWEQVSIEYDNNSQRWYLPQHPLEELCGLLVRFN